MTTHETIYEAMKTAMKNHQVEDRDNLRYILDKLQKRNIELQKKENFLDDTEARDVLLSVRQQAVESAKSYVEGKRPELEESELALIAILDDYLPKKLTEEETREYVKRFLEDNSETIDTSHVGKLTGQVIKWMKEEVDPDSVDGSLVKKVISELKVVVTP